MTAILTTSPPARNVIPSFRASDNSGSQSFFLYDGALSQNKKQRHLNLQELSEGSVSVETWKIYADLAGLMNAISLLQTQMAFLKLAQKSIHGLRKIFNETENQIGTELGEPDNYEKFSELSSFVIDVLNRTRTESAHNGELNVNTSSEPKRDIMPLDSSSLAPKFQSFQDLDQSHKLIQERLDLMELEKAHLLKLALGARLKIEEINQSERPLTPQKMNEATNKTLQQFGHQSIKAIASQTTSLPRKALSLIDN